jgi:hypothetical protein
MQEVLRKSEHSQPILEYGHVNFVGEGTFIVLTAYGTASAERAVSCLVLPRVGDTVLLSMDMNGNNFILSVLMHAREDERGTDLVFDGQVNVHVNDGDLSFTSDRNILLASGEELACVGRNISIHAGKGEASIGTLSFVGKFFESQVERVKNVADSVDTVYRCLTERLINAFRYVKEEEEVQTGSTRYLVEDTLTMHSKNAVHMSEEIVTINAEQVHLG